MSEHADTVFVNGAVFTADPARSWARAVAVAGDRISCVGDDEQVLAEAGPDTEVVDLGGRLLSPGFQDAHVHPATGGEISLSCNLASASGADQAAALIAEYAGSHQIGDWVRGGGWHHAWYPSGCPTRAHLDHLVPDRPAYLRVADGHSGWANSIALRLAGVTAETPDPPDGRIEREPDGSPQGTLHEGAMHLVERVMPAATPERLQQALLTGQDHLLSLGITAWQDAWVGPELHDAYVRLAADGRLRGTARASLWWDRERGLEQIEEFEDRRRAASERYHPGTVKLMLDGVCENHTASLLVPYLDDTGLPSENRGIDMIDPDELPTIVSELDRRGFQCHFHAIGDRAVRNALDAVETALGRNGWRSNRHHIAHIQIVDPADRPRFRRLGVAANAQALWACNESSQVDLTIPFIGATRAERQYPFASLLAAGAVLAMGSDWSVSTADVMAQISVAVERTIPEDRPSEPFFPAERIRLTDALSAFTAGSAWVNHLEDERGTIRTGGVADMAILAANPFDTDRPRHTIRVDMTMVGGEVVHRR